LAHGHGGRRIGAGRPAGQTVAGREVRAVARAALADIIGTARDPLLVLVDIATDVTQPATLRVEAAAVATRYVHPTLSAQAVLTAQAPSDAGAGMQVLLDRLTALAPPSGPSSPVIEAAAEATPGPALARLETPA
jgi:hypothetical protein